MEGPVWGCSPAARSGCITALSTSCSWPIPGCRPASGQWSRRIPGQHGGETAAGVRAFSGKVDRGTLRNHSAAPPSSWGTHRTCPGFTHWGPWEESHGGGTHWADASLMRNCVSTHSSSRTRPHCLSSWDSLSALFRFSAASLNLRQVQETGRRECGSPLPALSLPSPPAEWPAEGGQWQRILLQGEQGPGGGEEELHGAPEHVRAVGARGCHGAGEDVLGLFRVLLCLQ